MTLLQRGATAAALALVCSSCALGHLDRLELTRDNSLHIQEPRAREVVKVPLTISWRSSEPTATYAVFIDRAPVKVGTTLHPKALPHDTYVTAGTTLTLDVLPQAPDGHGDEHHEATIVLLDPSGTRRTESAWYVDFRFPRRGATT